MMWVVDYNIVTQYIGMRQIFLWSMGSQTLSCATEQNIIYYCPKEKYEHCAEYTTNQFDVWLKDRFLFLSVICFAF